MEDLSLMLNVKNEEITLCISKLSVIFNETLNVAKEEIKANKESYNTLHHLDCLVSNWNYTVDKYLEKEEE